MVSLMLKQIKVLLYRNFLLKKRQKSPTIQEVGMPIYFVVILVVMKITSFSPTYYKVEPNTQSYSLRRFAARKNTTFYVAPDLADVRRLVNLITYENPGYTYRMFASQAEMEYAASQTSVAKVHSIVGLYFKDKDSVTNYVLRFDYVQMPEANFYDSNIVSCREQAPFWHCPADQYLTSGFAFIQNQIDTAIIKVMHGYQNYTAPKIYIQRFPRESGFSNVDVFQAISSLYLVVAFTPFMSILMVTVVYEKEKKIREGMKMMGLDSVALWIAWGLTYAIVALVLAIIVSLLAELGSLYPRSNILIVFLVIFMYGLSLVSFGFMLTPFFRNSKAAGGTGGLMSVILGALSIIPTLVSLPDDALWAICLLSPAAFGTAISQISFLEVTVGANFSNLWQGPTPLAIPLFMLPVDILLYFILTIYFDQVVPGEYGQKRSPVFFLLPSFWCPSKRPTPSQNRKRSLTQKSENSETISNELVGKEAISIAKITKIYGADGICTKQTTSTTAVKNFSLDIYEGQITALLGHNGAGKTTLFNILTGFVDSTSGSASVYGYDVSNAANMRKIRQMTGVCPQLDILLDVLSVEEHLEVFAGIKGLSKKQTKSEIDRVIKLVDLEIQRHTFARKLSGGQKRKLSVGIAILGDPKILILDEPTAGMDPFSRNNLWDVLRSRKEGRVTLLTTHFMDEADILADRKAIISRGRLRCVGSSLFLKNKFGAGYHLGVVTRTNDCYPPITACVKYHVKGAGLQRSVGFELDYTLPLTAIHKFADLFRELEQRKAELSVQSFGVSMTTLEEVFLAIAEDEEAEADVKDDRETSLLNEGVRQRLLSRSSSVFLGQTHSSVFRDSSSFPSVRMNVSTMSAFSPSLSEVGKRSTPDYFFAMAKRLFLIYVRSPSTWIFGFVFPLALVVGSAPLFASPTGNHDIQDPPSVVFKPGLYNNQFLFKNSTRSSLATLINNSNVTFIPNKLDNLLELVDQHFVAGDIHQFDTTGVSYKALYNTKGVHSLPSILNLFSSAALSQAKNNRIEIVTEQKRWPRDAASASFNGGVFGGTIMAAVALVMITSFTALTPVHEREFKISTLMRVSGVRFAVYWGSSFTVDYAWYLIIATTFFIAVKAFNVSAFVSGGAVAALFFLVIGWGASSIVASYCLSFLFQKFETAQAVLPNLVQWLGMLPFIPVSLLDQLGSSAAAEIINVICVLCIPFYTGFSGLYYIVKVEIDYKLLGIDAIPSHVYFDWSKPMVALSIVTPYIHLVLLLLLLRYISVKSDGGNLQDFWKLKSRPRAVRDTTPPAAETVSEDSDEETNDDVIDEKEKVSRIVNNKQDRSEEQPVVLLHDLRKEFVKEQKQKNCKKMQGEDKVKVAVDQLSLTVYRGQVLGLLGPNGAGKTTAMNLITADFAPTSGRVFVSGQEVLSNLSEAFMDMGYCPQNNPLWDDLTLAEHLEIYSATQGVKKYKVKATIDRFVDELGIKEHVNKRAKKLSGGTKRKLCFAIAMLGNPQVVLLDEPSTGMDPKTKRFMWDTISKAFQGTDRGAILTTHYMEEADALCSRVAIMVLGKLKCIGSTQHLKSKFGQGYVLEVKLKHDSVVNEDALRDFVKKLFPGVSDPEQFSNRFVYKITQSAVVSLSSVFLEFERAKEELGIEEYSFSQSTLEQIFLRFAREQEEVEAEKEEGNLSKDTVKNV